KGRVLSPGVPSAGPALAHGKLTRTSVGGKAAVDVMLNTKLWIAPAGMSTGAPGCPTGWFVAASVAWNSKVAGSPAGDARRQPMAVTGPALIIVANAVAGTPTCTERALGSTAASSEGADTAEPDRSPELPAMTRAGTRDLPGQSTLCVSLLAASRRPRRRSRRRRTLFNGGLFSD